MHPLLLFDIDHTLIVSGGAGRAAIAAALAREFGVRQPLEGMAVAGRTDRAILGEALERAGLAHGPDDVARLLDAYLARLPHELRARRGRVLPGVPALLDALARAEAPLGLATGNVARGAEIKLRHYGLWERFPAGGFGDVSADRAEVVAAAIEAAGRAAGLNGNGAAPAPIVIGDTPNDVAAAHAAGARALGVATGPWDEAALRGSGAEFTLPDLSDTRAALAILLGQGASAAMR